MVVRTASGGLINSERRKHPAAGVGRRSGQLQYSDLAIETALTLSLIFH